MGAGLLLAAGLAVAPFSRAMAVEPADAASHAELAVTATAQDAGSVEQGTLAKFHFVIANRGQADLEITQVKPSCGCTVPHWDKLIKPGAEGSIDAEVNTTNFRGAITKHLTVLTNDPAHPQIELTLNATVTPLIQVTPNLSALISIEDQPATQEFTLVRSGGRPMKIVQVNPNATFLKVETTALPGEGRYKLAITATTDAPMGRSTVPVVVQTDQEKSPNLTLIVMVDRGIVAMPPLLFWSMTGGVVRLPFRSAVTISRQSRPFHVTHVAVDDPKLETKLETIRDGREYRVMVTYNGGWEGGTVKRMLTVTTDDPKQPELKVPVQAILPTAGH
jgi:uncharacterized protein DUF1573